MSTKSTKHAIETHTNESPNPMTKTKTVKSAKKPTSTHERIHAMPAHSVAAHETATATLSTESESAPMKTVHHVTSAAVLSAPAPAPAPATPTSTSTAIAALPFVKAPPPITLPPVPSGVVPVQPPQLRIQLPRKEELALMPEVESELARFVDYAGVFGKTAPTQAVVEQTLRSASQWSTLRQLLAAWEVYAQSQEVAAWVAARSLIARLSPAYGLAVKTDSAIGESYPSLGQLFGVRATIAKRAVAARKANTVATSEGKPAYKGAAGKRRQRADAKAALQAKQAAEAKAAAPAPAVPPSPEVPVAAPAPAAPVAAAPPPVAPPLNVTTVGHG